MNVTIVTTAKDDNGARELLKALRHAVPPGRVKHGSAQVQGQQQFAVE